MLPLYYLGSVTVRNHFSLLKMNIYQYAVSITIYQKKLIWNNILKKLKYSMCFWLVCPKDRPLSVFLCQICWGTCGRSTYAWERVRALSRTILHLFCRLWISPSLFPAPVHTLHHIWCQGRNLFCPLGPISVRGVEGKESKRNRQKCNKG